MFLTNEFSVGMLSVLTIVLSDNSFYQIKYTTGLLKSCCILYLINWNILETTLCYGIIIYINFVAERQIEFSSILLKNSRALCLMNISVSHWSVSKRIFTIINFAIVLHVYELVVVLFLGRFLCNILSCPLSNEKKYFLVTKFNMS